MPELDRRSFLRQGAAVAAGGALLGGPFAGIVASAAHAERRPRPGDDDGGYGPLVPIPDRRDGEVRLHLPRGFSYRSFDLAGTVMSDGTPIPTNHDGMAAFEGPGGDVVLVRNHEINGPGVAFSDDIRVYDPAAQGGTTTVVVSRRGRVRHNFASLAGTQMNCSGGPMPWGSWVSCEETVNGPDVGNDFTGADNSLLRRRHGYVFEVPAGGRSRGRPVRSAGRFAHEAVAYSPRENALYLTEDNFAFPSGFYRYLPPVEAERAGRIVDGGALQMLAVRGQPAAPLHESHPVGTTFGVEWVPIPDPDPDFAPGTTNDQAIVAVGDQGREQGAALFSRLEGAAYDDRVVYFCSTQGGAVVDTPPAGFGDGRGQIWAYDTRRAELTLVYESTGVVALDLPDNVAVSRRGTLVICEDGEGENFLRGLTADGEIFDFALNRLAGLESEEFAGSTFSPDGGTLFVNIQTRKAVENPATGTVNTAMTFAIWGPWHRGAF